MRQSSLFSIAEAIITLAGGGALYIVSTMAVHSDPAAVPSTPGVHAERASPAIEESRRLAHALLLEENLPGLSMPVARDGEIVWTEGFGLGRPRGPQAGDAAHAVPSWKRLENVDGGCRRPASRARIDLDAPVQKYVPAYPQEPWTLTTRQLMGDIAGIHRIRGDGNDNPPYGQCASLDKALARQ